VTQRVDDHLARDPVIEEFYRDHGMDAPWLLEWADGHPVLDEGGRPKLAPVSPKNWRTQLFPVNDE